METQTEQHIQTKTVRKYGVDIFFWVLTVVVVLVVAFFAIRDGHWMF